MKERINKEEYFAGKLYPKNSNTLDDHPNIVGLKLGDKVNLEELFKAFSSTGYQASNLGQALEIMKTMKREQATIILTYTSNMVTSGVREVIRYLVEHKLVDVLVTTAGGIEEDVMKCFKPFKLGSFSVPGKMLFQEGIHRSGNIFIPTDRYTALEQFLSPFLNKHFKENPITTPQKIIRSIGEHLDNDESILTWAARNEIPVFCPGLQDGAIGEFFYFEKNRGTKFAVDISGENKALTDISLQAEKVGAIILGGGIAKHFTLLGNILREGLNYAVFINTGDEFDGSDSGARPDEALTWLKLHPESLHVKVWCDATIAFPLLAAAWVESL